MTKDIPADQQPDIVEDEVDASRAPLLDHLKELRTRLIWCMVALLVGALACFAFATNIYNWLLIPYQNAVEAKGTETAFGLIYTAPLEFFFAQLKISLFGGMFLAFPVIAWQLYAFIAPGLYKNERYAFLPFLIAAPVLFAIGALFVFYVMFPLVMSFALGFEQAGGEGVAQIDAQIRVAEYLSLIMALMMAFGLSFQLPVVLGLLGKAGIVGASSLRKGRKYALVGILAASAFFTPPDIISQVMLTVPVYGLYEISIWIVAMMEKRAAERDAEAA